MGISVEHALSKDFVSSKMSAIVKEYLKEYYELKESSLPIDRFDCPETGRNVEKLFSELEKYSNINIALNTLWNKFSREAWIIVIMELFSPKRFFSDNRKKEIVESVDVSKITDDKVTKYPRLHKRSFAILDIDAAIESLWTNFPPKEWIAVFLVAHGYTFSEIWDLVGIPPGRVRRVFSKVSTKIAKELGGDYSDARLYALIKNKLGVKELNKEQKRFIKKMLYAVDSSTTEERYLKRRKDDKLGDLRQTFDRARK